MSSNPNSKSLKIHIAQLNFTVGDIDGNAHKIINEYSKANENNCDLIIFSEMAICGYPCEDLWLKEHFIKKCQEKIIDILSQTKSHNCAILLGAPFFEFERKKSVLRNSVMLLERGEIKQIINKKTLPNYGVFDENRYFKPSSHITNFEFRGFDLAVLVCEDLWDERNLVLLREQAFDFIISINASPFNSGKHQQRLDLATKYSQDLQKPLIYVNQVGGQDSLVFDGSSFVTNNEAQVVLQMPNFVEDYAQIEVSKDLKIDVLKNSDCQNQNIFIEQSLEQFYCASVLGLRDYVKKNNFKKVLIGMSGGIDSALVATIAVDALGNDGVALYALPTKFNSTASFVDAKACAENLNIELKTIEIEEIFQTTLGQINKTENLSQLAQENLQSRIRGNVLMAISNSTNWLLISTGNKSEMACGYATLYGDMNGAFNPIKDFYKTQIYELAKFRNQNLCKISSFDHLNLIPQNIISKEPSAELRYNQKDSDSLPEYEILDKILFLLIEKQKSIAEVVNAGFDFELVNRVAKLIIQSEYKRKQSVLGVKVSVLAFDKERRYPLTNKFMF
ncbi:MAG: NAD+ synthase [Proteobacteria bacterium]|nr:NAD+ synthase [Pseudomonadota bacterium]NCA27707.1 NAD+ synthase [Pseudomonadota bacterium]